ncbi:hypothetical protein G9A89_010892 [Geosiphon pyriformis]|nr:hypothetical protein G9A89_010892 [Geosiphon pyriformis]
MGGAVVNVKIRYTNPEGELENRKVTLSQNVKWSEVEEQLREMFNVSPYVKLGLSFIDEEGDLIVISSDAEIAGTLNNPPSFNGVILRFDLVVKPLKPESVGFDFQKINASDDVIEIAEGILHKWFNENLPKIVEEVTNQTVSKIDRQRQQEVGNLSSFIKAEPRVIIYPSRKVIGDDGEAVELLVPADYLTFTYASTKAIWGTGIYTADSDVVKALGHSGAYSLPKQSPDHDLAIILRFLPGCKQYFGSTHYSLRSQDLARYKSSYVIESIKEIPAIHIHPQTISSVESTHNKGENFKDESVQSSIKPSPLKRGAKKSLKAAEKISPYFLTVKAPPSEPQSIPIIKEMVEEKRKFNKINNCKRIRLAKSSFKNQRDARFCTVKNTRISPYFSVKKVSTFNNDSTSVQSETYQKDGPITSTHFKNSRNFPDLDSLKEIERSGEKSQENNFEKKQEKDLIQKSIELQLRYCRIQDAKNREISVSPSIIDQKRNKKSKADEKVLESFSSKTSSKVQRKANLDMSVSSSSIATLANKIEKQSEATEELVKSKSLDIEKREEDNNHNLNKPVYPKREWVPKFIPMQSPLNLVQETLFYDPWKHLIATMFLNRTRGTKAVPLLWEFFERYRSPQEALKVDIKELAAFLKPLGLQNVRAKRILRFSESYLKNPNFKSPRELFGMGQYAEDSWRLFCGEIDDAWTASSGFRPADKVLQLYIHWRRGMDKLGYKCRPVIDPNEYRQMG